MLLSMVNEIGFPKVGIGPFEINRVAFSVFGIDIYWYAIIITAGMISAILFSMRQAKNVGLTSDNVLDIALLGIPTSVIGARLFYVAFEFERYDSLAEMIDIRDGGLAIYGAVIVAFAVGLLYCKCKKISAFALFDLGALGFLIGQAVGRWGNFMNAEAHGGLTDTVFGMTINGAGPFHPTFLYESVWNAAGFVMLFLFFKFLKKHNGEVFSLYFFWYGLGRFFIETMRTDSLYIGELKINKLIAGVFSILGLILYVFIRLDLKKKLFKPKNKEYGEVYKPLLENEENNMQSSETKIIKEFNENKEQIFADTKNGEDIKNNTEE